MSVFQLLYQIQRASCLCQSSHVDMHLFVFLFQDFPHIQVCAKLSLICHDPRYIQYAFSVVRWSATNSEVCSHQEYATHHMSNDAKVSNIGQRNLSDIIQIIYYRDCFIINFTLTRCISIPVTSQP